MGKLLWKPSEERAKNSNMYRFMRHAGEKFGKEFTDYDALYRWSIDNLEDFWRTFWEFSEIRAEGAIEKVIDDPNKMMGVKWFTGTRLNFAENLLRYRDDRTALIFRQEGRPSTRMTYRELYDEVARVARSLREVGVQPGDRVVGYMPNMPHTVVAMLAATSIGATWSSCSPDFGIKGVLDRFGQIKPKVLLTQGYPEEKMRFSMLAS